MHMKKVSVVLSIYRPDETDLRLQLESLNRQTYGDLELVVRNDCPEDTDHRELFEECITAFPFRIIHGEKNLGFKKSFEKLVTLAEGEYISFCDQDDIWDPDKISASMDALLTAGGSFVTCNKRLIDGSGKVFRESLFKKGAPGPNGWVTGEDIADRAVFSCYATGMCLLAAKKDIERLMPFTVHFAHDHWLSAGLARMGKAVYVERPLVSYRRSGTNLTGLLKGVRTKDDYYRTRADNLEIIDRLSEVFPDLDTEPLRRLNDARVRGKLFGIIRGRKMIPDLWLYEVGLCLCPGFLFGPMKRLLFGES